jgi:hypothetical protein
MIVAQFERLPCQHDFGGLINDEFEVAGLLGPRRTHPLECLVRDKEKVAIAWHIPSSSPLLSLPVMSRWMRAVIIQRRFLSRPLGWWFQPPARHPSAGRSRPSREPTLGSASRRSSWRRGGLATTRRRSQFAVARTGLDRQEAYMLLSIIGELRLGTSPRPVMATRLIVPEE